MSDGWALATASLTWHAPCWIPASPPPHRRETRRAGERSKGLHAMETRCVLLLLCASCGGGTAGEIDLVLENRTSGALVATTPNDCGAGYVQIFDGDDGRALAWRCGESVSAKVAADAIAEPIICKNQITSIPAGQSLISRWNGL